MSYVIYNTKCLSENWEMLTKDTEETIKKSFDAWCWLNRYRYNIKDYDYISQDLFYQTKINKLVENAKNEFDLDDRALCVYKNILIKEIGSFTLTAIHIQEDFELDINTSCEFYFLFENQGNYATGKFIPKTELLKSIVVSLEIGVNDFRVFQIIDNDTVKEIEWEITAKIKEI